MSQLIDDCTACPPHLYNSCRDTYGPEWENSGSESGCGFLSAGCKLKCRYTGPTASAYDCCLGNGTGNLTCSGSYTRDNAACDATMAAHCAVGDRVMTDPRCQDWCIKRPDACKLTKKNYCVANLQNKECQSWCNDPANYEICSYGVNQWCDTHPTDPYCSCLKSKLGDPKMGINPLCIDKNCLENGYVPANMRNVNCPDIINCEIQAAAHNSGISIITNIPIEQHCGEDVKQGPTAQPQADSAVNLATLWAKFLAAGRNYAGQTRTKATEVHNWWKTQAKQMQYFVLFIFIVIIYLFVYLLSRGISSLIYT